MQALTLVSNPIIKKENRFRKYHELRVNRQLSTIEELRTSQNKRNFCDVIETEMVEPTDTEEIESQFEIIPENKEYNEVLSFFRKTIQQTVRDSGMLRLIINVLTRIVAAPAFYYDNPYCFPNFVRISEYPHWLAVFINQIMMTFDPRIQDKEAKDKSLFVNEKINFHKESYGAHPSQTADVMVKENCASKTDTPLFIFFHGGAWGSGFPSMYRLISLPFLERNYRCVILGYRTYPDGGMKEQVEDLINAVKYFTKKYRCDNEKGEVVLVGHSSGAHIAMIAALKGELSYYIDAFIGMSGVYDLELARDKERVEGFEHISPMGPAAKEMLKEFSPLSMLNNCPNEILSALPPILLLHGKDDTIAPPYHSEMVYDKTKWRVKRIRLQVLESVQHQDTVLGTCLNNGKLQETIFDWLKSVNSRNLKISQLLTTFFDL